MLLFGTFLPIVGCHSAFMQATVVNRSGAPIQLFEVDYPQASFGAGSLPAGASFHYRFKVSGEGTVLVSWTDMAEHEHKAKGPLLHEGNEGAIAIELGSSTADWKVTLHNAR